MTKKKSLLSFAVIVLFITIVTTAATTGLLRGADMNIKMVVNPANPISTLTTSQVADIFIKRVTKWPGGSAVMPVDQKRSSPTRKRFTESFLKQSLSAVDNYWQQMIFSGRATPPPELPGDLEVIKYVMDNPGAIGYVTEVGSVRGIKVLQVSD